VDHKKYFRPFISKIIFIKHKNSGLTFTHTHTFTRAFSLSHASHETSWRLQRWPRQFPGTNTLIISSLRTVKFRRLPEYNSTMLYFYPTITNFRECAWNSRLTIAHELLALFGISRKFCVYKHIKRNYKRCRSFMSRCYAAKHNFGISVSRAFGCSLSLPVSQWLLWSSWLSWLLFRFRSRTHSVIVNV